MKKFTFFITFLFILNITININAQWVQVGPFNSMNIYSLAIKDSYIFAGAEVNGVFTSTNNGQNWTQTALNNQMVFALAAGSNFVFAGTGDVAHGIYITSNYGVNWTSSFVNNQSVSCIAVQNSNVFAGTPAGVVLHSTNNGQTWVETYLNAGNVEALLIKDSLIFAGTTWSGVYLSTNNGQNWIQDGLNNLMVTSFAFNGNNIYAGACSGNTALYLSTDNGGNWTPAGSFSQCVHAVALINNNIIIGTQSPGIFVSTNNGQNWTQRNEGMGYINIRNLLIANGYIFAGSSITGLWRRLVSEIIGIKPISHEVPAEYRLSQNYPNPFNPSTSIEFDLPKSSLVKLVVYNMLGREVATLVYEELKPGSYEYEWNGSSFASGVYFYRLITEDFSQTKSMVLLK